MLRIFGIRRMVIAAVTTVIAPEKAVTGLCLDDLKGVDRLLLWSAQT